MWDCSATRHLEISTLCGVAPSPSGISTPVGLLCAIRRSTPRVGLLCTLRGSAPQVWLLGTLRGAISTRCGVALHPTGI